MINNNAIHFAAPRTRGGGGGEWWGGGARGSKDIGGFWKTEENWVI